MPQLTKFPGALKKGDNGSAVGILQALLQSQGYYQGQRIDNDFGPRTEAALAQFQMTRKNAKSGNLAVTGVLDKATWSALQTPVAEVAVVPKGERPDLFARGLNDERVSFLRSWQTDFYAGTREVPDGSNYGGNVTKYLVNIGPAYWCCFALSWHFHNVTGRWPFGERFGLCSAIWAEAKQRGVAFEKGKRMPIPGDAFVLLYRNSKGRLNGQGHIGVVTSVSPDGKKFNTFAGNEGNALRFGHRLFAESTLVGFISLLPEEGCQPERKFLASADAAGATTR